MSQDVSRFTCIRCLLQHPMSDHRAIVACSGDIHQNFSLCPGCFPVVQRACIDAMATRRLDGLSASGSPTELSRQVGELELRVRSLTIDVRTIGQAVNLALPSYIDKALGERL